MAHQLNILRVFDKNLTVLGYCLPQVAGFEIPGNVRAGQTWQVYLHPDFTPEGINPEMDASATYAVKKCTFTFDQMVFYGPGKYAGSPPDGQIHNLILLEGPEELWQARGWIKRHEPEDQCSTEIH